MLEIRIISDDKENLRQAVLHNQKFIDFAMQQCGLSYQYLDAWYSYVVKGPSPYKISAYSSNEVDEKQIRSLFTSEPEIIDDSSLIDYSSHSDDGAIKFAEKCYIFNV